MSAEIIHFIPRPRRHDGPTDFPAIAFRVTPLSAFPRAARWPDQTRSAPLPDDLAMDHADTAPCEHVWPDENIPKPGEA